MANAPKPNPFFRFCGSPAGLVLFLSALFLWCTLCTALPAWRFILAFPLFFIIPLFLLFGQIGLFMQRKIVTALLSIVLTLAILLNTPTLARGYESLRFRLLEPQMRAVAEKIIANPEYFTEEDGATVTLPWYLRYLTRGAPVHASKSYSEDGVPLYKVNFMVQEGFLSPNYFYVYRNIPNAEWENDPDYLTAHFCLESTD